MNRDIFSNTVTKVALAPQALSSDTATAGIIIDTDGYESGVIELLTGAVTAGDIIITKIEEGDDSGLSDAADIPAARLIGASQVAAIDAANTANGLGFVTTKQYVRATFTTDNSANLLAGAVCVLGHPHTANVR